MLTIRPWPVILSTLLGALALAAAAPAMEAEDCLGCHGEASIADSGPNLYINPIQYAGTPHANEGCPSCHASVTDSHPDDGVKPSRPACADCHDEVKQEYAQSAHAGNAECADCHNVHAVRGPDAVSGLDVNRQCATCHDEALNTTTHATWLPQARLHLNAMPCITCHTASKNTVITLYIERRDPGRREQAFRLATYQDLRAAAGTDDLSALIDRNADHFISLAELRTFHSSAQGQDLRLWGMMMPEAMTHSFEILENRWDCTFCHTSGPGAAQKSYVAFPQPSGAYARVAVEPGAILDLLYGTPDFYMMGKSRNDTLSLVGLLIIAGGLVMPLGHGTLRFLTRANRREH
ncbi:MAG: cytochrome C [Deltaproteobacteria bacterium]|nr:cytochrome C [Deltaproteobacteria bacterium]